MKWGFRNGVFTRRRWFSDGAYLNYQILVRLEREEERDNEEKEKKKKVNSSKIPSNSLEGGRRERLTGGPYITTEALM